MRFGRALHVAAWRVLPAAARFGTLVRGVVLESPVLNWNATLDYRALALGVPGFATVLGKWASTARAGLDWDQLDRVAHGEAATVPILGGWVVASA